MQRTYIPFKQFVIIVIILLLLLAGALWLAYYYYHQYTLLAPAQSAAVQSDVSRWVNEVGQLIELPKNETPTVATVTDPSALKDQPFFAQAQVGDKVLIYTNAGMAVLYRPSTHKLIEVGPISTGANSSATPASSPTPSPTSTPKPSTSPNSTKR